MLTNTNTTGQRLIDLQEVSRRTGIPIHTIKSWVKRDLLPYTQFTPRGKVYFSARLVERIIQRADGRTPESLDSQQTRAIDLRESSQPMQKGVREQRG